MIPTVELNGSSVVPSNATFWMPSRGDIDEEGIGGCRDTWTILDVPVSEARAVVRIEQEIIEALDAVARDAESFERMAGLVENIRELDEEFSDLRDDEQQFVEQYSVIDDGTHLGGLEVGVAGLVNALAAVRMIPAASCRSHVERSWSPCPVVLFAATKFRAEALSELVEGTGCALDVDTARPALLAVMAPSSRKMVALATAVIDNKRNFVQPRQRTSARRARPQSEQLEIPL